MKELQRALWDFARNTVLRAGAGTGKTEALTGVFLHLVSGLAEGGVWGRVGLAPERVVALTFTEKAAAEMRDRIAEAVALLSFEAPPEELVTLEGEARARAARRWAQPRGLSPAALARVLSLADSAARSGRPLPPPELWRRVGLSLGSARIGTFHGYAAGVLRAAALDLGLDPGFRVLEQEEAERLLREACTSAVSELARRDVAAVADLMASAGGLEDAERGLLRLVAELLHRLEEAGLTPEELEPAALAVPPRVERGAALGVLRTFAEACETVEDLREDGTATRMARLCERLDGLGPWESVEGARQVGALLAAHSVPGPRATRRIELAAADARVVVETLRELCLAVSSELLAREAAGLLVATRRRFSAAKAARSALDFADLMQRLRNALSAELPLRRACKDRIGAMLVDEFQDTNRVQRDLVFLLRERRGSEQALGAGESLAGSALEPHGLLLVGDAKQSIYAFRGADVAVFLETERALVEAGGQSLELTGSHRALDAVVAAVNPLTEALLGAGLVALGTSMYDRARDALVAEAAGDGHARAELLLVPAGRAEDVRTAEAEAIARRIEALVSLPPAQCSPGWRPAVYDDIAILVPSWTHTDTLRRALKRKGIPYALLGGPGFWERREVDDLVTALRLAADPSDRLALASVLRGPVVGLSDAALAHLFAPSSSLEEVLDPPAAVRHRLAEDDRARLDEARPTLRRMLRHGATVGPSGVLRWLYAERGLAAVQATQPFGAQRVANMDKLLGLAESAESRGGEDATLGGFVRFVDRMRSAGQHETDADVADVSVGAVQILSIHAAKGLEWPVVFVAQSSRRRRTHGERLVVDAGKRLLVLPAGLGTPEHFRDRRQDAHAAEDDDQRRLLYVALTRARDLMVVSGPADEGEGDWQTLQRAMFKLAPLAVTRIDPGLDAPALPVREHGAREDALVPAEESALVDSLQAQAPAGPTAFEARELEAFARCPRWYAGRVLHGVTARPHERLEEDEAEATGALLRWMLARAPLDALRRDPVVVGASLRDLAQSREPAARSARAAAALVRWAKDRELGPLLDPASVLGRSVPVGARVGSGARALKLLGEVDLLTAVAPGGGDALTLLRVRWGSGPARASLDSLVPEVWALALERRYSAAGASPRLHRAQLQLTESSHELRWLDPLPEPEATLLAAASELRSARREGVWSGRERPECERVACEWVERCHGA